MGSIIGAGLSYKQYRDSKKDMKKAEDKARAEEARAKAMTPAEAQIVEDNGTLANEYKKRKGVQATMLASKGMGEGALGGTLGG